MIERILTSIHGSQNVQMQVDWITGNRVLRSLCTCLQNTRIFSFSDSLNGTYTMTSHISFVNYNAAVILNRPVRKDTTPSNPGLNFFIQWSPIAQNFYGALKCKLVLQITSSSKTASGANLRSDHRAWCYEGNSLRRYILIKTACVSLFFLWSISCDKRKEKV